MNDVEACVRFYPTSYQLDQPLCEWSMPSGWAKNA